jgi:DnaJ like chaperone protein
VKEYHPDKIASKGLPEEFTKFAQDKFREIQEAYNAVKQERGI